MPISGERSPQRRRAVRCCLLCDVDQGLLPRCAAAGRIAEGEHAFGMLDNDGNRVECSLEDRAASRFDPSACKAECNRNACDLQYRMQAHWNTTDANQCRDLDFTRWRSREPNADNYSPEQLCCLCSQGFCDDAFNAGEPGGNISCVP